MCEREGNKCSVREVAEESDGSSVCRRIGLQGETLLHPTMEGQLRVIGSLVLGGELLLSLTLSEERHRGEKAMTARICCKKSGVINN